MTAIPETKSLWAETTLEKIRQTAQNYSEREKTNTRIAFLMNAINKVSANHSVEPEKWDEFKEKTENLLQLLPEKTENQKLKYGNYLKAIAKFKSYIRQKFNYIPKGFNLRIWVLLGIPLGLPIGVAFGQLSLGIPFGVGIGLVVGSYLDRKAATENRVL